MADSTHDVHVTREFNAPIERLWTAWTQPDDLRAWWGLVAVTGHGASARRRGVSVAAR